MPEFAPCELCAKSARVANRTAPTPIGWNDPSPPRIKAHDCWGFRVAWLWQLGPRREDIHIHAYRLQSHAKRHRPRQIPFSRRAEVLFQGDAVARCQRDAGLQSETQTQKASRQS